MRMELEIELRDVPGALAPVLDVLAQHGANVHSVVHRHEDREEDRVPVVIQVEVPGESAIPLIDALTRRVRILRVDQEGGPVRTSVLLSGHVFQANLEKLLDTVFEAGGRIERVDARVAGRDRPSAVLVDLSADQRPALDAALERLRAACTGAGLTVMDAVRRDADG